MTLATQIHFHSQSPKDTQRATAHHDTGSIWVRFEDDPTSTTAVYFFRDREEFQDFASNVDKVRDATRITPRKGVDVGAMVEALERIRRIVKMERASPEFKLGQIACRVQTALDLAGKQGKA